MVLVVCLEMTFFNLSDVLITRGHSLKLELPNSRIDCRMYFFCVRIINVWNSLTDDIVCAKNVSIFKNKLKSVNLHKYISGKV